MVVRRAVATVRNHKAKLLLTGKSSDIHVLRRGRAGHEGDGGRHGATLVPLVLEGEEAFVAACLALDRTKVAAELEQHPEYRDSPKALFAAAKRNRADAVALLLDLGTPIELHDEQGQRALHVAAAQDALAVVKLLVERGAVPERVLRSA